MARLLYHNHEFDAVLQPFTENRKVEVMGEGGYRQINKTLNACAFEDCLSTQQNRLPHLPNVEVISLTVTIILGFNPGKVRQKSCRLLI